MEARFAPWHDVLRAEEERRDVRRLGRLGQTGLTGAVHLFVDELFAPNRLSRWLPHATPAGRGELAA
ncbi:hypothetical protein [Paractinoplanes toevensis]|uniref:Uncharacterized protein n=1 Tax=Paractinoplanes toevensis TaxID=571911 RepID=A0A919T5D1_9ACTN|nr:hypothetical protein [Actinoplanes toevensis]GIM89664.1 hypothetical protein Ato02nite_014570 [Actinoplanes toevensis]